MHQLAAYLIAAQQVDRLRQADRDRLAHEVRHARERAAAHARAARGEAPDILAGLDGRRAIALVALAVSRGAAGASRFAAGTARRIDPCLDEGAIRRAVGSAGR